MGMSLNLNQSLSLQLSQGQILAQQLSLLQRLSRRLHGDDETYSPKGTCTHCERRLTPAEIIRGFSRSLTDTTTKCPRCKKRFQPILRAVSVASSVEIPFYCKGQTVAKLTAAMASLNPDEFRRSQTAIYRSAMFHFGSLTAAFRECGIRYKHEPKIPAAEKKIRSYLGRLPDSVIASHSGLSVKKVRALRESLNIGPYSRN